MTNHQNMNATSSDTQSATRKTLRFSENGHLLPSKIVTMQTVEAVFANAVLSLPDNTKTSEQVKKEASAYTKLLSNHHRLMDKLKRFDDTEFLPHAVRLKIELKASKSVISGPNASEFSIEKSDLEIQTQEYQEKVKASMRKVAFWTSQEAKRDLCNYVCLYAKDLIATRLIDQELADSSDLVTNDLIQDLLNDLIEGTRTIRTINTFAAGSSSSTPTRTISKTPSLLTPVLFGIKFLFTETKPPTTLSDEDAMKYATLLNTTASDIVAIFGDTVDANKTRLVYERKAMEKAKLLARISTTKLVENTAQETEIILENFTTETLSELIEKGIAKRLREYGASAKAKSKAMQSSSSSSTTRKEKDKKKKKKTKDSTTTSPAKKSKGAASSTASSKKKSRDGKKGEKSPKSKKVRKSDDSDGDSNRGSRKRRADAKESEKKKKKGRSDKN